MAERNLPNRLPLVDGAKMKAELLEIGERETERGRSLKRIELP